MRSCSDVLEIGTSACGLGRGAGEDAIQPVSLLLVPKMFHLRCFKKNVCFNG